MIRLSFSANAEPGLVALRGLDLKTQRYILKPATQAVAKLQLDTLKRLSPKQSGAFRRSLMVVTRPTKSNSKTIVCLVGQRKQRKTANTVNKKGRSTGSQITRAGKAVPIHFLDRTTRAHTIKPLWGKAIRFPGLVRSRSGGISVTRRGKVSATRGKTQSGLIMTKTVKHPGTSGQRLMARTTHATRAQSSTVFMQVVATQLGKTST